MSKLWMLSLISCAAFALPACTAELTTEDQELLESETLAAEAPISAYIYGFNNGSWVRQYTTLRNTNSYSGRFTAHGMAGDIPLLVPSEYSGQPPRIAVFRPSTAKLYVDYNDNGYWDNATVDREISVAFRAGDKPFIVMGKRKRRNFGICQASQSTEIQFGVRRGEVSFVDQQGLYSGSTQFGTDGCPSNIRMGLSTDIPVVSHRFQYVGITRADASRRWTFDTNQDGVWSTGDWDSLFGNGSDIVGSGPGPASQRGTTVFWDRNANMWWDAGGDATFTNALPTGYVLVGVAHPR